MTAWWRFGCALALAGALVASACASSARRPRGRDAGGGVDAGSGVDASPRGDGGVAEICDNGRDDDGDGLADCDDLECQSHVSCGGACGDGTVDEIEDCDLGTDNGPGSCCSEECRMLAAGQVCRPGSGDVCDPDEVCDGTSPSCPLDVITDPSMVCRVSSGDACDPPETCSGEPGLPCPTDAHEADGTSCTGNGEDECTMADTCLAGVCADNDLPATASCGEGVAEPTCNPDRCDGAGACTDAAAAMDGAACSDSGGNTCCAGACVASPMVGVCDACRLPAVTPRRVTIIESRSFNSGHDQDLRWQEILAADGHTVTISMQTALDDLPALLSSTDVLIVASGQMTLSASRVATIRGFVEAGRGVYLQSEYDTAYSPNQAFATLVGDLGGSFTWSMSVSGTLTPTVSRCFAESPTPVSRLEYFWYGAAGTGTGVIEFLHQGATPLAYARCRPGGGLLVTTTDQDWVREANNTAYPSHAPLLRNIFARLTYPSTCP